MAAPGDRYTRDLTLRDGTPVHVRPLVAGDRERLATGLGMLSPQSRYRRFFAPKDALSDSALDHLLDLDYVDRFALGVVAVDVPGEPGIAVARYMRLPDEPDVAELAVTVVDEYQGRGIGSLLVDLLAEPARDNGIRALEAVVLPENGPMLAVLRRAGMTLRWDREAGAMRGRLSLG